MASSSSSSSTLANKEITKTEAETDLTPYLPLYKAAITGDWKSAEKILKEKPDAVRAIITGNLETVLLVAAQSTPGEGTHFVKELIAFMKPEDLNQCDRHGYTALHYAVRVGNIEAAKLLVLKNPNLLHRLNLYKSLPLHQAPLSGRKEMVQYMLNVTKEEALPSLFEGISGNKLVHDLIRNEFYDITLSLVQQHSNLAITSEPWESIVRMHSAFLSGTRLNFWQRLIYTYVPFELEGFAHHQRGGDIENIVTQSLISVRHKLHAGFWKVLEIVAPQMIKNIRDKKIIHHQARELVKQLCKEVARLKHSEVSKILGASLKFAACAGIHEVVEEIVDSLPSTAVIMGELNRSIFQLAIKHRRENVFNLVYQFRKESRHYYFIWADEKKNMCLHSAGNLENEQKLRLRVDAAGAALQMQRELHWFKEVEKHTLAADKESMNIDKKTPAMLFTETHKDLVKEGEQWMKDTANSCTIVAALIVTIVFAAAITVPGGNNGDNGLPIFSKQKAFVFFAISDALALFSSTSSLLMFLSILTSRYGEEDFLYALPKRLIIGLVTLFVSIISMMMAFGAILFLVFGHKKAWMLIPVGALSCIPVSLFASLQFPLLLDMIKSTYGPGMFGKQSNHLLC